MSDKPFTIVPATRTGIIPLIGIWGGTGGGKTESALRLARGMAGPKGRVAVIDTEAKRASFFVDRIPGGFLAIDFAAPYTPERYIEALDLLEKSADVGVIDSASHCWEGPDGILDLHEQMLDKMTKGSEDYRERERLNWPAWREPKMRWKPLRSRILGFTKPLVVCFRGEQKTHMERVEGRNTVVTDATTSPIFDRKFIFEMHVACELFQKDGQGGWVRYPMPYAKTSHNDIRMLMPKPETEQITIEHGANLMAWCQSGTTPAKPIVRIYELKKQLWELAKPVHLGDAQKLQQFLWDENLMETTQQMADLTEAQLGQIIAAVPAKLPK